MSAMLLFLVLLGVVVWIVVSVPIALLFAHAFDLEESESSSMPVDAEFECVDQARPVAMHTL
jgi:hypothetical protein